MYRQSLAPVLGAAPSARGCCTDLCISVVVALSCGGQRTYGDALLRRTACASNPGPPAARSPPPPAVFEKAGIQSGALASAAVGATNVLGTVVAAGLMDKAGRK